MAHARGLVLRIQARRAGRPRAPAETRRGRAIADETAKYILGLRREDPRRSVRVLMRAAKRRTLEGADKLAKSSVVRLLRAHGLSQRPRATPEHERRAFTVELPGDLWMGDAMHGPPVIGPNGVLYK